MALRIDTDGTQHQVAPKNGRDFQLDELQAVVDGYIEAFYLRDHTVMFLNEDGKRLELPVNSIATGLAWKNGLPKDDYIVGNVIIVTRIEAGEYNE